MTTLLLTFKIVSLIFATSAIITGVQSIVAPVSFSNFFGLPVEKRRKLTSASAAPSPAHESVPNISYVSLMGIRQLATGITLFTFAYQGKWQEVATVLCILGSVVATTDGFYLYRSGAKRQGIWHAVPGGLIALLAFSVLGDT